LMTSTMLIYTEKFYEAQKYLSCIDPFTIPHMPILNKDWYEALPEDLKPVVDECMIDFVAKFRELNEAADIEAISLLADGGLEVKQYSGSEKQEFANACAPLWTSFPDTFGGKEVVDDAIAFIEEYRASK
jgi:TRAP-type C4-dicarboxylate transport system substrate-binding protein